MTKVHITPDFINDLRCSEGEKLFKKILCKVIDQNGNFLFDRDDHRYKGIEDAWIRVVSKGNTAYRVIYLVKDKGVYLYRAGTKKIEQRLSSPTTLKGSLEIDSVTIFEEGSEVKSDRGELLKTKEPAYLYKIIESMYHVPLRKIIIVSPFVSLKLLNRYHPFGSFLDRAIDDDTEVTLITLPPKKEELEKYEDLDLRCLEVYFKSDLHSKIYMFDIDTKRLNRYQKGLTRIAIIGSSNFTKSGIGFDEHPTNCEVCFRIPLEKYQELSDYVKKIEINSTDFVSFKSKFIRRQFNAQP
jgi:hypothetical protein